ncbi:hypothetical protein [Mycobacterium sp. URHB0044]|jgi:hypothetical protein|uniref:hypothetical protein n=1 Tax=Mycobacterium sp. URHB0044 TaxID=1380386 RepID=UPI00055C5F36|nr:hypothetical protein [Mycobacterium sp. URHB0044]
MIRKLAITVPWLGAGLFAGLVAVLPISGATTLLADGPTSTAIDTNTPIAAETGAPVGDAGIGTDPLVPYGIEPQAPVTPGYVNRNHDEGVTSNGEVDLPF